MSFDFSAVLVLLTFVSGVIWGLDSLLFAPKRVAIANGDDLPQPVVVEYAASFFPIFLIVLILRSFIFEPFRIPSGSMMPTLLVGDFILVNKFDYGLRLPVLHTKLVDFGSPVKGDVVVFRYPEDPSIPYIKRIVGVAGDHVVFSNKVLTVNGVEMNQRSLGVYHGVGQGMNMTGAEYKDEQLADIKHEILVINGRRSHEVDVVIPEGNYFVLGDNRDNSKDSRYWGFVPDENLVGRAFMIWMNWDSENGGIDFRRIGKMIYD